MFFTAKDYWYYKFREVHDYVDNATIANNPSYLTIYKEPNTMLLHNGSITGDALTPMQLKWNSYLSIANMIPNVAMVMLNAAVGHKFPMRPRLLVSLIGIIVLFTFTDVMAKVNTDHFQHGFLTLTLITVVIITSFVGILQVRFVNNEN